SEYMSIVITPDIFEKEIAPARTFCLQKEVDTLLGMGLGKGASYDNTLVVSESGVVKNKLRFTDEFVRHKIIDLLGDMYLLGFAIRGHVIAVRSGHDLNIKLIQKIKSKRERWLEGSLHSFSTQIGSRIIKERRWTSCSTIPALLIASTIGSDEPSMTGSSSPSISMKILSMPSPESAAIVCSTVWIQISDDPIEV
ncbi:MAG: UDP-3-O-acyl-N-acetylglucosamine deacetylase, partial [Candidatus Omnitrophota bacterium]